MRYLKRLLLVTALLMFFFQSSATCPYCGKDASATGHTKTINTIQGPKQSCEYAHPINIMDSREGKHVFWQLCN
jgi:hypothetical protein